MTRDSRHGTLWKGLTCLLALQLPLVTAHVSEVEKATNASLLWGPYRPNLYFGVRPRIPKSLMGGLMWTRVEDYQSVQNSEFCHQWALGRIKTWIAVYCARWLYLMDSFQAPR
jgi:mannosyl-oligosaccharide glucosidase